MILEYDPRMSFPARNGLLATLLLVSCFASPAALAQRLERGAILVATPSIGDTSFVETVILLLDHTQDGSIGVIINRPTNLAPRQVFPDSGIDEYAGTVFYGGPVLPTRAFVLLRDPDPVGDGVVPILDGVYLSGGFEVVTALEPAERSQSRLRVYAGHARWGGGQLAAEVAAGAWAIERADVATIFSDAPLDLWRQLQTSATRKDLVRASGGLWDQVAELREVGVQVDQLDVTTHRNVDRLLDGGLGIELHVGDQLLDLVTLRGGPRHRQRGDDFRALALRDPRVRDTDEQGGFAQRQRRRALEHAHAALH
jgi:putative transcriptional regulator